MKLTAVCCAEQLRRCGELHQALGTAVPRNAWSKKLLGKTRVGRDAASVRIAYSIYKYGAIATLVQWVTRKNNSKYIVV